MAGAHILAASSWFSPPFSAGFRFSSRMLLPRSRVHAGMPVCCNIGHGLTLTGHRQLQACCRTPLGRSTPAIALGLLAWPGLGQTGSSLPVLDRTLDALGTWHPMVAQSLPEAQRVCVASPESLGTGCLFGGAQRMGVHQVHPLTPSEF